MFHIAKIIEPNYFMLKCNYIVPDFTNEFWLVEILNGSRFFRQKCPFGERYVVPEKQDNGEPDAVTSTYSVDFKLLVDQRVMSAMSKNKPDIDYSHMGQGYITVKTHDPVEQKPTVNLLADFLQVTEGNIQQQSFQNDTIKNLLKNLEKNKNQFLYYPYEFHDMPKNLEQILGNELTKIFSVLLSHRSEMCPNYDTFVCIKVNTDFLIYEWDGIALIYRDKVSEYLCPNYMDAKRYSLY